EHGYPNVRPTNLTTSVPIRGEQIPIGLFEGNLPNSDVPIYFIAQQHLFNRSDVYGYEDDVYRFAFFSRAIISVLGSLEWIPDIIHAHDWHAAGVVLWLKTTGLHDEWFRNVKTAFTIHNLAHQGRANWDILDYLGIVSHSLHEEPYGEVNLMARGLYYSDAVTTVSPTYAQEITTEAGGAGLHGLLRHRGHTLYGILNGLDTQVWDPSTDPRLPDHFDAESLDERIVIRHALQDRVGLPKRDDIPLVAMISRLDWQKGLPLLGEVIHRLLNNYAGEVQLVVLGSGQPEYETMLTRLANTYPNKMVAITEYNAGLAPLIYGGSDMFLMPSLFEPCGLSQLISMRYGSIPIARATGGLVDTVEDGRTGFLFDDYSVDAFWEAVERAIYVYNLDKPRWRQMQLAGMAQDFSWRRSAEIYVDLYQDLLS
ncbi:MAG: glycogen synthase, partial [Candidatus Promineifilaceae bacterium]